MHNRRYGYLAAAAVTSMLTLTACGGSGTDTQQPGTTSQSASPTSSSAAAASAHNDADVMFAQMMIPHHQQAVEMSDMLLAKQGIDPQVVALANEIKGAQAPEIEQMRGWLDEWGVSGAPASSGATTPGHDMPGHTMPGGGDMPGMGAGGHGMMSQQDMTDLQNAQGVEASRLFLTQMIEHHRGAITMAQQEIDGGKFPPAVQMAQAIVSSQQEEITTMERILKEL
ncbi:DUF305 domain-containing protein [Mycobacterium sp. IS-1496]|uniref:DUF305 domain-containing protein n=1 Tax=Mycobacterium sp. IS-1496 TaxID=1772284 RepID=UPI0007415F2A|nr:DUF305 domain-containing protein [Mycobacterium sp. IS-1496]KUI38135.1 DUF305 domain-containing protein [Mycobacterium sp. IS-1496]